MSVSPLVFAFLSYNDVFMVMENIHIRSDNYIGILSIVIVLRGGRFWQTRTDP